jgi:hypothetical protein
MKMKEDAESYIYSEVLYSVREKHATVLDLIIDDINHKSGHKKNTNTEKKVVVNILK